MFSVGGLDTGATDSAASFAVNPEGFSVNVRNTEPMLRIDQTSKKRRVSGLFGSFLSSLVLAAVFSVFLISVDAVMTIPWLLAGVAMYVGISYVRNKMNERFRVLTFLIIIVLMIASLIVLRGYIYNGFALIVNGLFERSEAAQAYVYDMYRIGKKGDANPDLCMGIAAAWCSAFAGFVTALPPPKWRSIVNTALFIAGMLVFTYLGVLPPWAGLIPLIAVFLISAGNGRFGSMLPLILAVLLVFGGIILLDPGENYAVSRTNENLRDLFAIKTALIQSTFDGSMDEEMSDTEEDEEWDEEFEEEEEDYEIGSLQTLLIIIAVVVLAILVALFLLHRRLSRKRKKIREGLDNRDPNIAIGAMFPYAVRWLRCYGIDASNMAFADIIPEIKTGVGRDYSERYSKMLGLWREAVFSDHKLTDENRIIMSAFMKDTMTMARKKANWKEKLKIRFKYAL